MRDLGLLLPQYVTVTIVNNNSLSTLSAKVGIKIIINTTTNLFNIISTCRRESSTCFDFAILYSVVRHSNKY